MQIRKAKLFCSQHCTIGLLFAILWCILFASQLATNASCDSVSIYAFIVCMKKSECLQNNTVDAMYSTLLLNENHKNVIK